jgi:hypothetical protein
MREKEFFGKNAKIPPLLLIQIDKNPWVGIIKLQQNNELHLFFEGVPIMIYINGNDLTLEQVIAVARGGEKVEMTAESKAAVNKARE